MRISVDLKGDTDMSYDYCFENFVENALEGESHSGLMRVDQKINNLVASFGRLLEHLALKGEIAAEALATIVDSDQELAYVHDIVSYESFEIKGRGTLYQVECNERIHTGDFVRIDRVLYRVVGIDSVGFGKQGLFLREVGDE